jgi:very-short-patch-repair endonuclease
VGNRHTRMLPLPSGERAGVRELRDRARRLRQEQTDAERTLWWRLRARQVSAAKFRRQHVIGNFIVDFCCPERKLVVEVDGGQHVTKVEADRRRTQFLVQKGYTVLRFWDHDILINTEVVLQQIADALGNPHPSPLPEGRGER